MRRGLLVLVGALVVGCGPGAVGETPSSTTTMSDSTGGTGATATTGLPTTTTEAPVLYEAGVLTRGGVAVPLGYWEQEADTQWQLVYEWVSGVVLDVSEESILFHVYAGAGGTHGSHNLEPRTVAVITVAFGNYQDDPNRPLIRRLWFGRPGGVDSDWVGEVLVVREDDAAPSLSVISVDELVAALEDNLGRSREGRPFQVLVRLPTSEHDRRMVCGSSVRTPAGIGLCEDFLTQLDYRIPNGALVEEVKGLRVDGYSPKPGSDPLGYFDQIVYSSL